MKAKDLRDSLNRMADHVRDFDDLNVTVVTRDPSIGPSSKVAVHAVAPGIDWDKGSLLIWTEEPIVKRNN